MKASQVPLLSAEQLTYLKRQAREIRRYVIEMLTHAGSGHTGGSLSCVEIITALYFHVMRHRPHEPKWPDRDRFILSKGHGCPTLYAALALAGYFPISDLFTLRKLGSHLQGHPELGKTPGIEMTTGSLGQGLSVACGIAIAGKWLDKKDYCVYVLLGDGEIQEGQIWEAAMAAAHYKLDNLCAFIDYNKLQLDGKVCEIMNIEPIAAKWDAFGWHVIQIDGHNFAQIIYAASYIKAIKDKPVMIIAHTIKGKGSKLFENKVEWHGKAPTKEECEQALKEILGESE